MSDMLAFFNKPYSIEIVPHPSEAYQKVVALRYKILRKPLQLEFTAGDLSNDSNEIIIGMFDTQRNIIACVQLRPIDKQVVKLRQMAVDTAYQRKGLGKKLLRFAEQTARNKGFKTIELHARKSALDFYKKSGYQIDSDAFTEVGILHYKMNKIIVNYEL